MTAVIVMFEDFTEGEQEGYDEEDAWVPSAPTFFFFFSSAVDDAGSKLPPEQEVQGQTAQKETGAKTHNSTAANTAAAI